MQDFLIVAVGASAGGVKALKQFFHNVPGDTGIAYVAILHLSPEFDSRLDEVLQVSCQLPVTQVRERIQVQPNHVYVISPNQSLSMTDGHLAVSPILRIEERRAPVDIFFRTLAETQGSRAVCVLLSGTGADGSMGLKRVKEHGGLCIVQDPAEAEHPEMPKNAIGTGLVDYVLPLAQMAGRIVAYRKSLGTVRVSDEGAERVESDERAIRDIFSQLRTRTGHDFTNYKRSTMWRRLERRLAVHEMPDVTAYAQYLRSNSDEAYLLLKDLLISVTNFFRDKEAFERLEQTIIPKLFEGKTDESHVRTWIVGCATGEEAYSIAMLLAEHSSFAPAGPSVQIFATDIDDDAIAAAREALYTTAETADVSAERLRRFFVREGEFYRVRKELREMVLFARHNVIKDPPFSHLDLVSCRNLMIYLNRGAQHRVLDLLHFGLKPAGYLFLGSSESMDGSSNLFVTADKDANIFQSRAVGLRPFMPLPEAAPAGLRPAVPLSANPDDRALVRARERLSYADLHQRLLEEYAPPSVVVNEGHEILHLTERAAAFLQFSGGEPSVNLLKAIRPELRLELRTALYQAAQQRTSVEARDLKLAINDTVVAVNLTVRPVLRETDTARGFFLVIFDDRPTTGLPADELTTLHPEDTTRQLEEEVMRLRGQLRATIEQHEVQAEELKASNEELQAMNEELRSTAEELETSKEELQSVNEELTTVNQELKIKIEEQSQATNDIQNLINTTEIAAVFLDRSALIKLFTPRAREIFNLIHTDRGRPLSDISSLLQYEDLHADVERVLARLERVEREVRSRDGRWHLMQIVPYRTSDDRIDGVVLTFIDVTEQKRVQRQLQRSEERLRHVLESITDYAIITLDYTGVIEGWNGGAERMFGYTAAEAIGQPGEMIFTPEDRERGTEEAERHIARAKGRAADDRWHVRKDGTRFYVSGVMSPLGNSPNGGFVKVATDLTQRKQHDEAMLRAHDELESRVAERTQQLEATNVALGGELRERRDAEDRVRKLLSRLITVQEDERRRIARDLHDDLGQKMTALHLKLESLRRSHLQGTDLHAQVQEAQAFVQQLDRDLDFFTWELRPAALYDLGLLPALRDFTSQWAKNYNIAGEFHAIGIGRHERFRSDIEINLYRIAQEALNNVYKHARASKADVVIQRRNGDLVLSVEDDGVGFDVENVEHGRGIGLIGMRERAALMNGTLQIERSESVGTTVIISVAAVPGDDETQSTPETPLSSFDAKAAHLPAAAPAPGAPDSTASTTSRPRRGRGKERAR